jgi:serine/threonine protein kinase
MEDISSILQRTQLYSSSGAALVPFWPEQAPKASPSQEQLISSLWNFLATLESSGLRQFRTKKAVPDLHGGQDAIAEGSTYVIDTRKLEEGGKTRLVAVKRLKKQPPSMSEDTQNLLTPVQMRSIVRDVSTMLSPVLKSDRHVLHLLGYGWDRHVGNPSVYLVVEYSPHGTLRQVLKHRNLSWDVKFTLCGQAGLGLDALHRTGIAHGDVKLDNVLIFYARDICSPTIFLAKIADFGSSIDAPEGKYTGTRFFNAPEARSGSVNTWKENDTIEKFFLCDVYSFGLLFLESLLDGCQFTTIMGNEHNAPGMEGYLSSDLLTLATGYIDKSTMDRTSSAFASKIMHATLREKPGERESINEITKILQIYPYR